MKLKAFYLGYVTDKLDNIWYIRFQDTKTKETFDAEIEEEKIEPKSERKFLQVGAYFRIAHRRQVTFKFFKCNKSKSAYKRRVNRTFRRLGKILSLFE